MDSVSNRASETNHNNVRRRGSKFKKRILVPIVLVVLLLVALAAGFYTRSSGVASTIDGKRYQAVFFTSGQVYFGKLSTVNSEYFRLTDVFYVQASNTDEDKSSNPQESAGSDIRLIKLGSEVHAPDDEMIVSKDQVLFFENLKNDGKVADSITKYNEQNKD